MSENENLPPIYVASRVVRAPVWRRYREKGYPIISSWIDEAGAGETKCFAELWDRIRSEIERSAALVFYADGLDDFPFKGALVEAGIALALGKPVFVCLKDVELEGRTMRPIGSWVLARNVTLCETLDEALARAMGYQRCPECKGVGEIPATEDESLVNECNDCEGTGAVDSRGFSSSYSTTLKLFAG